MSGPLQRGVALAAALVLVVARRLDGPAAGRPVPRHRLVRPRRSGSTRAPTSAILGIDVGDDHRRRRRWATGSASRCCIDDDYDVPADANASSWRRRWCPTATCSSPRSTTAAPPWRTAPRCPWTARPSRSSSTRVYGALDELSAALGPDRRQRERRAVRPRRRRRGQPRRQRRRAQPHAHRLLAGGGDPGREPRRPVRLAGQPADLHHRAGDHRRAGRPVQRQHGGGRRPAGAASGPTSQAAVAAADRRAGRRRRLRAGQHDAADAPTSTGSPT